MEDYKHDLNLDVLMCHGIASIASLEEDEKKRLSEAIVCIAYRSVGKAERRVFSLAYHCAENWEQIHQELNRFLEKPLTLNTVSRYGRSAARNIVLKSKPAVEMKVFVDKFQKRREQ